MQVDQETPRSTTVDLGNATGVLGQVWTVKLSVRGVSTTHTYTAVGGEAAAVIAQALADHINTNAATAFTAVADGGVLVVINREGEVFATSLTLQGKAAGIVDRLTPTEATINLDGTPVAGETWRIQLSDGIVATMHTADVVAGDTLVTVAQKLANAINATADASFVAVSEGDLVLVVRRDERDFSVTPSIVAIGQPVAGERWKIEISAATGALFWAAIKARAAAASRSMP